MRYENRLLEHPVFEGLVGPGSSDGRVHPEACGAQDEVAGSTPAPAAIQGLRGIQAPGVCAHRARTYHVVGKRLVCVACARDEIRERMGYGEIYD